MLDDAIQAAYFRFKKFTIKKRSGEDRHLIQPAAELKLVIAWLDAVVLSKLPVSDLATAFQPGTSIVMNAEAHRKSAYSVRLDVSGFFPSIRSKDLIRAINDAKPRFEEWVFTPAFEQLVRKACFDRSDRLPVGYPSSPRIANAVMYELDMRLNQLIAAAPERFGQAVLTRYADDFVFSTDKQGACRTFADELQTILARCASPKLSINVAKTRYMSRKGGSTLITGLRVNMDGKVGVHANYRDHIRLLLKLFSVGKLDFEEHEKLRGHLAFIEHADPRLFTKLSFKYYKEIASLRMKKAVPEQESPQ
ncbi:hypothetical protein BZL54_27980 [Burkholderia ubonensis subsp. mesacidophila]|uniref:RNA-directed DNA polymerase n=1 Tax=Burkholderia ubonensis subsp. mesacidophila TaxID=265293 RepID=A0A2A4F6R1_9BURK|nr:hypothetical protein BZL54_27980 [Burkholderia ubonensis subsp. mesacidophila]